MDKQFYKEELGRIIAENNKLKQQILDLTLENAELKDQVLDNGGPYAETDGYEVGSPSDYEEDPQLNLFDERPMIFESPDGGKTIYGRRAGDSVREQFNRECD